MEYQFEGFLVLSLHLMMVPYNSTMSIVQHIRGRDARYRAPPALPRTCSFPASGSSVILASAQTFTVTRYKV